MTPTEVKTSIEEMNRVFGQLQERLTAAEARGEKSVDSGEVKKLQDKLDSIELKLARPNFGQERETKTGPQEKSAHRKAVEKLCRYGEDKLTADETKTLTMGDDTTGGYLGSSELDREIIKEEAEITDFASAVRVRNTAKRSVKQPKRTGTFAAVWVAAETGSPTNPQKAETAGLRYSMEEIPNHEIYALVPVSNQDLEDSDYDLDAQIVEEMAEQFGIASGDAVINGTGNGQPEGVLTHTGVLEEVTGSAAAITYDGLVNVSHNGNSNYMKRGEFWLNLKTIGKCRLLKDAQNQPLWQPMQAGAPSTILGFGYRLMPDMPDVAAGTYPVVFGDFKRAYTFVRRIGLEIIRDPLTAKKQGVVEIMGRRRIGGQVMLAAAIRKLKCSV